MKTSFMLGRLLFGGFFLYSGIDHFAEKKELTKYARSKNVPMPEAAVTATGAALVAGGLSLLLGVKPKLGAVAVAGFLAGVTPVMHDFWNLDDPKEKQDELRMFSMNTALLGAALALLAVEEPWPASVPVVQPDTYKRPKVRIAA